MFKLLRALRALVKTTSAALFWAVVLALAHRIGWYPDEQIAGLFVIAPTPSELWTVFLGLVALLAIAMLFAEHWISPLIARLRERKSPLEIVFDVHNPGQQFWKRTLGKNKDGEPIQILICEYRVGIRNTSAKTIRNVRVSTETLGKMPIDPRDFGFQKNGKEFLDIAPGYMELVPVWWVWPPQAGDFWGPTATAFHGPLRVTARGDDVYSVQAEFDYFSDDVPALVSRGIK